jgi:vacuolar-type H+-ATPase subunit C/Vma6
MAALEIALVARAKALSRRLVPREALDKLAEASDLAGYARGLTRLGAAVDPLGESPDLLAIERAIERTASRYVLTLQRWQVRWPGVLDVFNADRERRSLRTLLRGAIQGAPFEARMSGVLPTPSLPLRALTELAREGSAAALVRQLMLLRHPDTPRLTPLVKSARPDLIAIEVALLEAYAERVTRAAAKGDATLRDFVRERIDLINVQNALLIAGGPSELDTAACFVKGGRWLTRDHFVSAATAESRPGAVAYLHTAVARSPLAPLIPVSSDVAAMDRAFLTAMLRKLSRASRIAPLGSAPLIRVLLRVEAQSHDLRALAWAARLNIPTLVRREQLVTPP